MNSPLLVRTYDNGRASPSSTPSRSRGGQTLPPIASFMFAEILRSADSPDFQSAIDGIAEICAKHHMSLADEYSSHLPPQGEITATSSMAARPPVHRPEMRRALTTVPEASSSGSEGSGRSKKSKTSFFSFRLQRTVPGQQSRTMRIGSMGRTVSISSTTAISGTDSTAHNSTSYPGLVGDETVAVHAQRSSASKAIPSLHRILDSSQDADLIAPV